ncbi:GFA family protein [Mesorhizobium sp. RCC_202]|uniref:GFA family protein n=1 Tax=Mesorhizobium sp. RCC_202 TaxID=3239222 RepID=UPI003525D754
MTLANDDNGLTGGCQCGAIRYRVSGRLTKPHVCHCRMCQKAVGAPFFALAETDMASFEWTRGAPAWFRSSAAVERGFCAQCGTSLHFRYVGVDRIDVALVSLDDPEAIAPQQEFGCESRLSWLDRLGTLPRSTTEATTPAEALKTYASR